MYFMKHMPLLFIFFLFLFVGCQESTKKSSSTGNGYSTCSPGTVYSPGSYCYCQYYPTASGCYGTTTGTTGGGTTGVTSCTTDYYTNPSCPGYTYCQMYPTQAVCSGTTTGTTTGGSTVCQGYTGVGNNPCPYYPSSYDPKNWYYYSTYIDQNWGILYPYVPSISCSDATTPSGASYTPYETRKGTITLRGGKNYDPASGQAFFSTTSELLQSVGGARNFFWGDSTLKVRFKSNLQPNSRKTTDVCPERSGSMSTVHGYGKLRFDLYLVGRRPNPSNPSQFIESTMSLGTQTVSVNTCTPAIDLSSYAEVYTGGIYLQIKNVNSNQSWLPGNDQANAPYYYDVFGYISPNNPYVNNTWTTVRTAECWSLDIEVAADGTKTF